MSNDQLFEAAKADMALKFSMLRAQKNIPTVEAFAKKYQVSRVQCWRIERRIGNPTLRTLVELCAAHNMTIEEFFTFKAK